MVTPDKDSEKKPANVKTMTLGDLTWVEHCSANQRSNQLFNRAL